MLMSGRKTNVENTMLKKHYFFVVVMTSEAQRCDNVMATLSDVATKIQPKPNVVTTTCTSWGMTLT